MFNHFRGVSCGSAELKNTTDRGREAAAEHSIMPFAAAVISREKKLARHIREKYLLAKTMDIKRSEVRMAEYLRRNLGFPLE